MSEIKRIPAAKFLVDNGLLFEINRTILHPLGLALEVISEEDGSMRIENLWDYRDDPEGMLYTPETFVDGKAKLDKFLDEFGGAKFRERQGVLGFLIQERPDQ